MSDVWQARISLREALTSKTNDFDFKKDGFDFKKEWFPAPQAGYFCDIASTNQKLVYYEKTNI
jgi:hypothetical protein